MEIRYPFYDQRLVEFCFALPPDQKLSDGWTRYVLRNSLAGVVPEEIRWRYSKADFRPYFQGGMAKFSTKLLEELIVSRSVDLEPYLDVVRLGALTQRFISGIDCKLTEVEILYRTALFSAWLQVNQL
jgi:asparagine synthase (glutamine-hydrolysing)